MYRRLQILGRRSSSLVTKGAKKQGKSILLLGNAHNSLSQAVGQTLKSRGHTVNVELALNEKQIKESVSKYSADLIICPMLTARVPKEIWQRGYPDPNVPCVIVHPGVQGDKGMSAIDWAMKDTLPLGVTCLSAVEEMDAGPVWATRVVRPQRAVSGTLTKSSVYKHEITRAAVDAVLETVSKFVAGEKPKEVDPQDEATLGTLRPTMPDEARAIDFGEPASLVCHRVAFSDSQPGAPVTIGGEDYLAFDAVLGAPVARPERDVEPGTIVREHDGAVAVACGDGQVVWLGHLQQRAKGSIKLKASHVLPSGMLSGVPNAVTPHPSLSTPEFMPSEVFRRPSEVYTEVWTHTVDRVCYVMFEFYNGAMSTDQCRRLSHCLQEARQRNDVDVIVLTGGYNAFSNGIHLNVIHSERDGRAPKESWDNINAINDVVLEMYRATDKLVVSALRSNAGAGGFMMALAADFVMAHEGVVVNPHYKGMGLYGSEYWTHSLPRRVGSSASLQITNSLQAFSALEAQEAGMLDGVIAPDVETFQACLHSEVLHLKRGHGARSLLGEKELGAGSLFEKLERCRQRELAIMRNNFATMEYKEARTRFVMKKKPPCTPAHLTERRGVRMDGAKLAKSILKQLSGRMGLASAVAGRPARLGIVLAEGRDDSSLYVTKKVEAARAIGVDVVVERVGASTPEKLRRSIVDAIQAWNEDPTFDGIMVQLPIRGISGTDVCREIGLEKDVDCLNPTNFQHFLEPQPDASATFLPPCPLGILKLLLHYQVPLKGRRATVIGTSSNLGLPVACLLSREGCQTTMVEINAEELTGHLKDADIVVSGVGSPGLISREALKDGAVVVDVGISFNADGKVVGDLDDKVREVTSLYSPVPGGVGPMTIATLLWNLTKKFEKGGSLEDPPYMAEGHKGAWHMY
jgi:putative two-component system hydrogenase maturation factor HypX/HoxX